MEIYGTYHFEFDFMSPSKRICGNLRKSRFSLCNSTQKNDVRNQYSWTSLSLHKITSVVTNKNNVNVAYNSLAR